MKGRKDNPDDRKRQGQHKRPNTSMDRYGRYTLNRQFQHLTYISHLAQTNNIEAIKSHTLKVVYKMSAWIFEALI